MERVAELLQARKWVKKCLRTNIPDNVTGNKVKVAHVASNVLNHEKEPELYEAIRAIAPEWWEDTRITLNKDVVAKRHRGGNKGHSWMIWLGDYEGGGELHFDDGRIICGKGQWHKFEGQVPHWNVPHYGGTKFSVILFRSSGPSKASRLTAKRHLLAEQRKRAGSLGEPASDRPGEGEALGADHVAELL
jgi:hypothetical protein